MTAAREAAEAEAAARRAAEAAAEAARSRADDEAAARRALEAELAALKAQVCVCCCEGGGWGIWLSAGVHVYVCEFCWHTSISFHQLFTRVQSVP